jgi:preprotein translocase subunit SecG
LYATSGPREKRERGAARKETQMNLAWWWLPPLLNLVLIFVNLFMILLVLIQRGKGGGLSGALGGVGGSSPFGSRAGDLFTRITIYTALIWLFLIMVQVRSVQDNYAYGRPQDQEGLVQEQ